MPVRIEPNAEPIPGYRLIERLGGGGFGEVWKAEAPGGLLKAIKFVFGDLEATDDADGVRATQELKALSRVKTVQHPYILSLERYDIIDGQLIIVMELAHQTLWDRFRECRNQGLPGIPREELLIYMRETAEALDLMNIQFQLQHLDIKPQNLFLVFNHVKVADFGLVKDLGNMAAATVTGGVTPVYAAPETFDGWLSRFSDQYSLAIVYQELLTGKRPFAGSTMRQLVLQHLQCEPDVSSLPTCDRAIVQHALAKNPDERFPTCLDFIQALRTGLPSKPSAFPAEPSRAALPGEAPPGDAEPNDGPQGAVTQDARVKQPRSEDSFDTPPDTPDPFQLAPPRPSGTFTAKPAVPAEHKTEPNTLAQRPKGQGLNTPTSADSGGRGIVQPSLIVGLGKLGVQTLLALRRTLSHEFGHPDAVPHIRLLGIDTNPETIRSAGQGGIHSSLRPHELVLARLRRPSYYLQLRDRDGNLPTDPWLNSKLIYRLPKQQNNAGLRALGRLAFVDNYRHIAKRFESQLQACVEQDTMHELEPHADLGIRSPIPRVYVIAGLAGSTGGGMFLDAAYALRHLLRRHGYARAEVVGLFYLPSVEREGIRSAALAQTYAALTEMHHYASGQTPFSALYDVSEPAFATKPINEAGPPFERCFLLTLPAPTSGTQTPEDLPESVALAGQFLYRDVATQLGKAIDGARQQWRLAAGLPPQGLNPLYQTIGLYRIVWPRKSLLERSARHLSQRLVENWMVKDARHMSDTLATWAQEQWDACGLRPEDLIAQHQERCEQQLKQSPERLLQSVLTPLAKVLTPPATGATDTVAPLNLLPVVGAMANLEQLLGIPDDCRAGCLAAPTPGTIEKALAEIAGGIADTNDHQLSELIVRLLEEPAYRLAGAEEGLRQFCHITEQALQAQETLLKELNDRTVSLYQRIQAVLESPQQHQPAAPTQTVWMLGFSRKSSGNANFGGDLLELIRVYAKTRYQSLVLTHINRLYVSLRGYLSDQIREIGFCRQRLGELSGLLHDQAAVAPPSMASFEKLLLPQGCATIDDAVKRLDDLLTLDDIVAFDRVLQPIIKQQYRALLNVCMGPANLVRTLAPLMVLEAETFLAPRFAGASVAGMWMTDKGGGDDAAAEELAASFDEAAPELGKVTAQKEVAVVAFPTTPAGQQLKSLAEQVLPGALCIDADRNDEITFYRELQQVTLQDLEQYSAIAQEAYRQRSAADPSALHSRNDVTAWQPAKSS